MGHVYVTYNNKTSDGGCLQSGCGGIIMLVLLSLALRGCVAMLEPKPATVGIPASASKQAELAREP